MRRTDNVIALLCLMSLMRSTVGATTGTQVSFAGANGVTLSGTLQQPDGPAPHPAFVLLAGSGPTDRNGNQPGLTTNLLKQIAEGLADRGIISLRFDKRGMYANSADLPKDQTKFGDFFAWNGFVGDAAAAYRFLQKQPNVDLKRVGFLGHSEGGLIALDASRQLKAGGISPAALVLISTPGRSIDLVIAEQLQHLLERQHATPEQTKYFVNENARITGAIQQTGQIPPDVPPGLAALYPRYLGKFLHEEFALDPCKLAVDFSGPALVIAGTADTQVSPNRDAKKLQASLVTRKSGIQTLAVIPSASHNMKLATNADDPGFEGPVAPEAMDELQKWIVKQFGIANPKALRQ